MKAAFITHTLHSRGFALTVAFFALVAACFYSYITPESIFSGDKGFGLPSANLWAAPGTANLVWALAGSAVTALLMWLLNKVHNVMRAMTSLYLALFSMMQLATPELMTTVYTGTVLAVIVPLCMLLLFNCYRNPGATRQVFLTMCLLSFFSATQYCFIVYIPAFLIGCAQMRIFNRRTLAAALMGIATPWIMLFGFGVIDPTEMRMPEFVSIFQSIDFGDTLMLLLAVGTTVFAMLVCYVLNVFKTIAYNARSRAINGVFTIVMLFTLIAMCADVRNLTSYVPLLNFCAAMEITHFFSTHRAERSFIAIMLILAVYLTFFICQTVI